MADRGLGFGAGGGLAAAGAAASFPGRPGYLSLDSNERSKYQARELKSVYLDCTGRYLKFLVHRCYINRHNLFNQVRRRGAARRGAARRAGGGVVSCDRPTRRPIESSPPSAACARADHHHLGGGGGRGGTGAARGRRDCDQPARRVLGRRRRDQAAVDPHRHGHDERRRGWRGRRRGRRQRRHGRRRRKRPRVRHEPRPRVGAADPPDHLGEGGRRRGRGLRRGEAVRHRRRVASQPPAFFGGLGLAVAVVASRARFLFVLLSCPPARGVGGALFGAESS